jgi:hypothetical protein
MRLAEPDPSGFFRGRGQRVVGPARSPARGNEGRLEGAPLHASLRRSATESDPRSCRRRCRCCRTSPGTAAAAPASERSCRRSRAPAAKHRSRGSPRHGGCRSRPRRRRPSSQRRRRSRRGTHRRFVWLQEVLPQRRRGCRPEGSAIAIMAPSWPPRNGHYAGEKAAGLGFAPFGGRDGHVCLFADARSTATTGACTRAHDHGEALGRVRPEGSAIAIMAPVAVPRKPSFCRGKGLGVRDSRPLGSGMDSSAWPARRCVREAEPRVTLAWVPRNAGQAATSRRSRASSAAKVGPVGYANPSVMLLGRIRGSVRRVGRGGGVGLAGLD